ncbi:conserved hypothetical protein [Bathymodiolus platifrons methanotrophic gill symbiont]|uniref:pentapeptide repeat-containing protein n=1 Tax=Bathymodiolus platifrons methanotrophic gill symbiont TaxID=113268 RepID=UPI000B414413|nr:pentapeptide repeat-containing protein [Bathymodiolus platifrons methanotrophic gill symbiont]GAW86317.1 conserved hypothetical protein [Bathymodiolus platifrons methanotrophic gill symbiont]
MVINYKDRKTISGEDEEAIDEFLAGKERWNVYVGKHGDDTEVDFSGVDFSKHRKGKGEFNFSGYLFPKEGNVNFFRSIFGDGGVNFTFANFGQGVSFMGANFGEGNVDFSDAQLGAYLTEFRSTIFGKGEVNFNRAKFGKGDADFSDAQFGEGDVNFRIANFGERDVDFSGAQFGEGNVDFRIANFGKGDVYFCNVNFGDGYVNFDKAKFLGKGFVSFKEAVFGDGDIGFCKAKFGKGAVKFNRAQFGDGDISFFKTKFGKGAVKFNRAQFGDGSVEFKGAKFGNGTLNFEHCEFKGYVSFQSMTETKTLSKFSLRHSSFDKSLDISDNTFNCIPDLTNTKLTNQVSLDRMEISDNYPLNGDFNKSDGERLCRLKELAEANKSHEQALDLHVIEMRAKRDIRMRDKQDKINNQNTKGKKRRIYLGEIFHRYLDKFFDVVCIYGQSIIRPVLCFLGLTLLFTCIYASMSIVQHTPGHWYDWIDRFFIGLLYSLSQVFPFVSAGRNSAADSLNQLFPCETIPGWFYFLSIFQGVLSFIFLFLIGLGLRNRFRL